MTIEAESIIIIEKKQAEKLVSIDIKNNIKKQQYIRQCTCRA